MTNDIPLVVSSSSLRLAESNDLSNHEQRTLRQAQGERSKNSFLSKLSHYLTAGDCV